MTPDDGGGPPRPDRSDRSEAEEPIRDLGFARLKQRHRQVRGAHAREFDLRLHRTLSWLQRAEREPDDPDARFLFLWIAFNAAYGERDPLAERPREKDAFGAFFRKLGALDADRRLYDAVWNRFSGPIRMLLNNRFAFGPFWLWQNGDERFAQWRAMFEGQRRSFNKAVIGQDTTRILSMLFDRLYTLRKQLVHGGATWNSSVNRQQVRDGAEILGTLVPVMAELMMSNPHEDWGPPAYPNWER